MLYRKVVLSFLCGLYLVSGIAQDSMSHEKKLIREAKWFALPLVFRTPETGWGGGAAVNFSFLLPKEETEGRRSQLQASFAYTELKQILVFFPFKFYWNRSENQIFGELGYYDYSDFLYPIGNQFDEERQKSFEEDYRYTYPRLRVNYLKKISKKSYLGGRYWFDDWEITEFEKGKILDTLGLSGSRGGIITGLGLVYQLDTRDNINLSSKGSFFEAVFHVSHSILGSNYDYEKVDLDYRHFWGLGHNQVLGVNGFGSLTFDDVPFSELALLGGQRLMRGYYRGFYSDRDMAIVQAEYRFPVYWRFSGVAFTGFGLVGHQWADIRADNVRPSVGFGLRVLLLKKDKINLRIDYGIGKKSSGFYLTVGEAF